MLYYGLSTGTLPGTAELAVGHGLGRPAVDSLPRRFPIGFGLLLLQLIADLVAVMTRRRSPFGLEEA
jgi:hypothetical protein